MDRTFASSGSLSSRKNSYGSCHSIPASSASSNQNSEDEDSDTPSVALSYKERRREAHTQAEQKRRDSIRRGYDELQNLVCAPASDPTGLKQTKVSKATVLQKSINQIEKLLKQKENQTRELDRLKKEVMALKIMKANYEHILKSNQSAGLVNESQLPDELKFQVFQQMMDQLFLSFNAFTSTNTFAELSACVIRWLEEHCKPQCLRELMHKTVSVALTQYQEQCNQQRKSAASVAQQQSFTGVGISTAQSSNPTNSVLQSTLISTAGIASSDSARAALVQQLPQLTRHLTNVSESNNSQVSGVRQARSSDHRLRLHSQQSSQHQQIPQSVLGSAGSSKASISTNPFTLQ